MFAVVGCGDCEALWIVETGAERSRCPRCGTTRPLAKRARFATAEDEDRARDLRTRALAERQGVEGDLAGFSELATDVEDAGIDDETYLGRSGLDADAVAAAGERAAGGTGGKSGSHREVVEEALRRLDAPTTDDVVAYATEQDVPADATRRLLEKLVRAGEATERDGVYRRL